MGHHTCKAQLWACRGHGLGNSQQLCGGDRRAATMLSAINLDEAAERGSVFDRSSRHLADSLHAIQGEQQAGTRFTLYASSPGDLP